MEDLDIAEDGLQMQAASPAVAGGATLHNSAAITPPLPQQGQQFLSMQQQQSQQLSPVQARYCKYFMQRVTTNVSHVLFYVVAEDGMAKLAVVGTDVKLSGHFVYASVSDMTEAPPLRCTNRGKVMEWLAALGASAPADDHEVVLPELAPHHWQQLHSADPMWSKPQLDRQYTGYREEVGTLPDGRHFKNYYLVDDEGAKKLMVMAEDGARLDRRYTYKAAEDVGGFCFENGKAVTDWLEFVLGKSDQPPSFMRRDAPPERKRKKKGDRGTPPSSHGRAVKEPRPNPYATPPGPLTQLLQEAGPSGSLPNHPMWQQQPPDDPLAQRHLLLQQQYPQLQHQLPPGRAGLYSNPGADPLGSVELRGGAVGGFNLGPPGAAVGGGPFGTQVPSGPGFGVQQQQLPGGQVGGAASGGYAGAGLDEPLTPRSMQDAVAAAGMEVRAVFSTDPDLLDWVTSMPDGATVERVRQCAERLELCVADSSSAPNLISEAYSILQMLCQTPVSLRLLELTGICRPVAMLSYHSQPQVREVATRLTQRWRRVATAAHDCASAALKAPMGTTPKLVV